MSDLSSLLPAIRALHRAMRDELVRACEAQSVERLARIATDDAGDTIYGIDKISEARLLRELEPHARAAGGIVLVAEGIEGGKATLPSGLREEDARLRMIVDPIDGTRGLMYQKRSAWILTGIAENRGGETCLSDIELAVQTEIPLVKQHLCDELWALKGRSVGAERFDRLSGQSVPLELRPSSAPSIAHGYAMLSRFFPGARDELAAIDEEVVTAALGPPTPGKAACFEDQYASSGGQFYELSAGHDRFNADLRPLLRPILERRGRPMGLCCHPYDVCTALIAAELGVIITDALGEPLDAPLEIEPDVAWIGYANGEIRRQIEPLLLDALERRGLLGRRPS
jgi:fructose-1,6-bisphosphatase/inositol monophosphatase family enzyme